jgi:hypothetical protein
VIGLQVYAPAAWFAILEVGLLGSVLGLIVGSITHLVSKPQGQLPNR